MRILLFLAVLGVVTATPEVVGSEAWVASPPAAAFKAGAGIIGYKIFGLVILFAAITSIIGAALYIRILLKDPASVHHGEKVRNSMWTCRALA